MTDLSIVFAGTPDFAAQHLSYLLENNMPIQAVYSQPDRPAGRGKKLQASPVKQVAMQAGIAVYQPFNFKQDEDIQALAALKPDILVVVAYGLLLPEAVLAIPRLACINVHASLLPRWRGAAPIERAIEAGDQTTGVTIMHMDKGLDTGAMLSKKTVAISAEDTGDSLRAKLAEQGCAALLEIIKQFQHAPIAGEKQDDSLATYAHKLQKSEAQIDWQDDAQRIALKIRAFTSSNVCFALYQGERIKLWQASVLETTGTQRAGEIIAIEKAAIVVACGKHSLRIEQLQLPNSKRMSVADVLNGKKDWFIQGHCFD